MDNHTFADEVSHLIQLLGAQSPIQVGEQIYTSECVRPYMLALVIERSNNQCLLSVLVVRTPTSS